VNNYVQLTPFCLGSFQIGICNSN